VIALAAHFLACGYRPISSTLPDGVRELRVEPLRARAIDEPELARLLAVELVRQLARGGVRASTSGRAPATLRGKLLALDTVDTLLDRSGRRIAGRALRLRFELELEVADRPQRWRSGLLEVEELWPLPGAGAAGAAEAARRVVLQRLAARAAEQAAELVTSGL
jgi:hypothetical protein